MVRQHSETNATPEMVEAGAVIVQNLIDCTRGMARDVARELFQAMMNKRPKDQHSVGSLG